MSGPGDSAGVPWGGRELTGTGFDGDTGEVDAALASALAHPSDETSLMAALSGVNMAVVDTRPYSAGGSSTSAVVGAGYSGVLVGYRLLPWLDVMAMPDLHVGRREGDGADGAFVAGGGRVGLAFHALPSLSVIPECSLLRVFVGPSSAGNALFADGDTRFQCGLSLSTGSSL